MRVMMSAAGSPVAPGIIRHLQSLGHYVIGHDCCEYGYGLNEVDEAWTSPSAASQKYVDFVGAVIGRCDLYLPFLDEEIFTFAVRGRPANIICSPSGTIMEMMPKRKQHDALVSAGLPVPERTNTGKVIAKPDWGRGSKNVIVVNDPVVAKRLPCLVQRFITGDEYTVDTLTDLDGEFLFAVPRLRIQANGVSIIGKIVMDREIIDLAQQVVSKFKFSGPINIQIIRERDTGKLHLIEVNPRLSGSCMFTVMAGFDILDATIRLHAGERPPASYNVREITVRRHYVEEML